jgi:hypothetical protein
MRTKKYKFTIMVGKNEEPYTGIFSDENGVDAYTRAMQWYNKHGKPMKAQGKVLVFRECLANGESVGETLPEL